MILRNVWIWYWAFSQYIIRPSIHHSTSTRRVSIGSTIWLRKMEKSIRIVPEDTIGWSSRSCMHGHHLVGPLARGFPEIRQGLAGSLSPISRSFVFYSVAVFYSLFFLFIFSLFSLLFSIRLSRLSYFWLQKQYSPGQYEIPTATSSYVSQWLVLVYLHLSTLAFDRAPPPTISRMLVGGFTILLLVGRLLTTLPVRKLWIPRPW